MLRRKRLKSRMRDERKIALLILFTHLEDMK